MEIDLTPGAVALMSQAAAAGDGMRPVLQVRELGMLGATVQNRTERYRLLLSDGTYMQEALLATQQLNALVSDRSLQAGSVVRLCQFVCNPTQGTGRRKIIIIDLEIIQTERELIGTPRMYETGSNSQTDGFAQIPQTGPSANLNFLQSPLNNPLHNETASVSAMMNNLSLRDSVSENLSTLNQNFQFIAPNSANASSSYPQPAQQFAFNQQPSYHRNQGAVEKYEVPVVILPISDLSPYKGRWTIKGRVTLKGELRTYNNPKGEGRVFYFDLIDSKGGEIRVTCFNEVAKQLHPRVELGKVYMISRGKVKEANKRFNPLSHEYELSLDYGSMVQLCEDDNTIPGFSFKFCQISDIESKANSSILDVIGVVTSISPLSVVMKKNGSETLKCNLQLKDLSGRSVELTLWGSSVTSEGKQLQSMYSSGQFPILAIKSCMVNEFNGKSLSCTPSSQLFVEPDFAEAQKLRNWFSSHGRSAAATPISYQAGTVVSRSGNRKTIKHIEDEGLGRGDKPDWVIIKGMITYIKTENFCYTACPSKIGSRQCNKKVTSDGDGTWWCERCNQKFPECDYRYLLQFQIQDHTGSIFATAFQEAGEQVMGVTAKELFDIEFEEQDHAKFSEIINSVQFKQFIFKLRVKEEIYNDEKQVKAIVTNAEQVDPSSESKYLLGSISEMLSED